MADRVHFAMGLSVISFLFLFVVVYPWDQNSGSEVRLPTLNSGFTPYQFCEQVTFTLHTQLKNVYP